MSITVESFVVVIAVAMPTATATLRLFFMTIMRFIATNVRLLRSPKG